MMCGNHKNVVVEFLKTIEESVVSDGTAQKIKQISEDIYKYERKLSKIVELNIDGLITKEDYESKYTNIIEKIEKLKVEQESFDGDYDEQERLREKIT